MKFMIDKESVCLQAALNVLYNVPVCDRSQIRDFANDTVVLLIKFEYNGNHMNPELPIAIACGFAYFETVSVLFSVFILRQASIPTYLAVSRDVAN